MIIIIDGQDNTGKSTLIKKILSDAPFMKQFKSHKVIHSVAPEGDAISEKKAMFLAYINRLYVEIKSCPKDKLLILDRSWISELVYAPMYRHYSGGYVLDLDEQFAPGADGDGLDVFLFVLIANEKVLTEREDGNSLSTCEVQKAEEYKQFTEAFEISSIQRKMLIDISKLDADKVKNKVKTFIRKNK